MFWESKTPELRLPMRIYRGNDPDLIEFPIQKTEDFFDSMGGFGERLKWAATYGGWLGVTWSVFDIKALAKITDRRMQIARLAFFTVPALAASVGWMAALEIGKKVVDKEEQQRAYVMAAAAPAAVFCVWRKRMWSFPKVFAPIAIAGAMYGHSVKNNLYFGMGKAYQNPNDPHSQRHKNYSLIGEARRFEFLRQADHSPSVMCPKDPGPTYAKFE